MNQQIATVGYHDIIAKVASIKDVDVDKLERLMNLQVEWEKRQAATQFNENMSAAQAEMTRISKDSSNPQTRSTYASLEALDEAIRPIYTEHGFSISFDDETPDEKREGWLRCIAYVSNGAETRKFTKWIPISTTGLHGKAALTPTHASIASVTYARRALLKMIFNLAEEDTDGNLGPDELQREGYPGNARRRPEPEDTGPPPNVDEFIDGMRACENHTALYTYGQQHRPRYLKLGPENRKMVDDIYKQMMAEFAEAAEKAATDKK